VNAIPTWKVAWPFVFWGLALVAGGWLVAGSWHDASPRYRVAAVGLVVAGLVAGVWNARQIPHRVPRPLHRIDAAISAAGLGLCLKVVADGLSPDRRFLFHAAIFAVFLALVVSLPTAYQVQGRRDREQWRRDRADREWSEYRSEFRGRGFVTRRWPQSSKRGRGG
jgi:peptidoglycan/LPS O-acetylase OafA/YrhL